MIEGVREKVRELSEEIVSLCRDLVRINTVNPYSGDPEPGGELEGQRFLEPILRDLGAETRTFQPPEGIYSKMGVLGPEDRVFKDRPNLVGVWDFGEGPTLVINGHMDTVAVSGMTVPPFSAEVRDGKIWGRGTSDCKGGLTVGLMAVRAVLESGIKLRGRIVYESVVDEESNGSGAGTLACIYEGYKGDEAIVVDGNDLAITTGCGGCLTADLEVEGREAHSASGLGVSAIEKALVVKRGIDAFSEERRKEHPDAVVNLGIFRSGVHPAVVPGRAYLSLNIVYKVEEAEEAEKKGFGWGGRPIMRRFEELVRRAEAGDPWLSEHPSNITWVKDLLPYRTDPEEPLVRGLADAFGEVLGREPVVREIPAWGDAAYLARLGGMPTVMFGPGKGDKCHSPDEYVEIEDLIAATEVLAVYLARRLEETS